MKRIFHGMGVVALSTALSLALLAACSKQDPDLYLFSYFMGNGEDGLHLAYSEDGLLWNEIRPGGSFLTPEAGEDRLMRDPNIIRDGDGRFHMVWTVSWNEQGIGYASSGDLVNWSEQRYIPVMHHEPTARNCWAPELIYDKHKDQYMIYWATTIPGRFPETDSSGDNGYNHRMYYTLTKDFKKFSETQVLYDHGFSVIDASIQEIDNNYVMFLKDETRWPEPEKNIRVATSEELTGPYSQPSASVTGNWVEGPTAIETEEGWILYFDRYRDHQMGAIISGELEHWEDISDRIKFPEGTRHGSVFRISREELEVLLASAE